MTRQTNPRPRKRKTIVEEEIPESEVLDGGEPVNEFDLSLEQVRDAEQLNAVLEQYGIPSEGILFRIYRIVDGQQRFVFEQPKLDESYIQQHRGGGNYIARLFINGKFRLSIPCPIEDLPENERPNGNASGVSGHSAFLEKMLMALILKENHGSGTSLAELTTAMMNLDTMRGKHENPMDTFIKGLEMGKGLDSGGGPGDWKMELLKTVKDSAPAILGTVSQLVARSNGNGGMVPPVTPQPMEVPQPPVPSTPEQEAEMLKMFLRQALGQFKSQFMMGLDPQTALELVLANTGNPNYAPLIQAFATMSFEELVALDADIGKEPFQSRFRALHDGLRSELSGDDSMEPDTGRNPGNVTHLGSHGDPRKTGAK